MSDRTPAPGSALHAHPHQPPPYRVRLPLPGLPSGQTLVRGLPLPLLDQSAAVHSPPPVVSARVRLLVQWSARRHAPLSFAPSPALYSATRGSWTALFQQTSGAIFLLNPRRRIRYVNRAFEKLAHTKADLVLHEYCHPRKIQKDLPATRGALLQTLAPPAEVFAGRVVRVRRPVPPAKLGPPWWEITFLPLREGDKTLAILGVIEPIGQLASTAHGKGLPESLIALRQSAIERFPLSLFAGERPEQRRLHAQAELAANSHAPVWIIGGPGTGKETLARAIHYHGITRELAFTTIDCAGLQPYLIRSLLAGHNGLVETGRIGTLYLKEPEALPLDLQTEIIEWGELLEGECRIVVGTTGAAGISNDFRAVFGIVEIQLPNLAEQVEDLPRLVANLTESEIACDVLDLLSNHPWPGNLGEFRDVIASAARRSNRSRIEISHLAHALRLSATHAKAAANIVKPPPAPKLDDVLEQVERRMIAQALRKTKGDQTAAAELLGIFRNRLIRRIKALGINDDPTPS